MPKIKKAANKAALDLGLTKVLSRKSSAKPKAEARQRVAGELKQARGRKQRPVDAGQGARLDDRTRRLSQAGVAAAKAQSEKLEPWEKDRQDGAKVYKLLGYTTSARVDRKYQLERRQRSLRKILVYVLTVIILLILFSINKPIKNIGEIRRILGIDSILSQE
ncbi:MAG: hypothetical protein Q4P08_01390 [Eubacteriales bacterium]|nr:hypothetical protein [Eubacteriales bacterium]